MSDRLAGKHAVVTGAGSGIGRAIAESFHREGASVALLDRRGDAIREVEAALGTGPQVVSFLADVSSEAEVAKAFQDAASSLGSIDIVVANAGIQLFGRDAPVDELELDAWQLTIDVNLTGMFLTCKYGIRALLSSGGGCGNMFGVAHRPSGYGVKVPCLFDEQGWGFWPNPGYGSGLCTTQYQS